jgi:hypothetical protein
MPYPPTVHRPRPDGALDPAERAPSPEWIPDIPALPTFVEFREVLRGASVNQLEKDYHDPTILLYIVGTNTENDFSKRVSANKINTQHENTKGILRYYTNLHRFQSPCPV